MGMKAAIKDAVPEQAWDWGRTRLKDVVFDVVLPSQYRAASKDKPVDETKAVFIELTRPILSNSFYQALDAMRTTYGCTCRFISLGQHRVGSAAFYKNCMKMAREVADAKYIFICEAVSPLACLPLRSETRVVQLWHACGAFKKFGMSTADKVFGSSREAKLRHPAHANTNLVSVSSPNVAWAYIEALQMEDRPNVVQPLGTSRTDQFFDPDFIEHAFVRVHSVVPAIAKKQVILYAPTFRGRVAAAEAPDQLDIALMHEQLGEDHVLLIKHHPHIKKRPPIPDGCEDFAFDVTEELSIEELLVVADVCVSDYSSLVFEYSLFERPMAFFAYDLDDYDDWRGFYYDYDELTPGPVVKTTAELTDYIAHVDERFDREQVAAFRRKFMGACDGHATDRIIQAVMASDVSFQNGTRVDAQQTCNDVLARTINRAEPEIPRCARNDKRDIRNDKKVVIPSGAVRSTAESRDPREAANPEDAPSIDISIVMPTYNSAAYMGRGIDSVLEQTYPHDRMELIVVDDCSTDSTWERLQEYEAQHPGLVRAFRLSENSGSGAAPRNRGIEEARGEYIFFLDSDDWFAPRAVKRMLRHAHEWGSDILLVKQVSENDRGVAKSMFKGNRANVDLYNSTVLQTIGALKLYRRSLIVDNAIVFVQEKPEDVAFALRAYARASVVSVASDYDYYHYSFREEDAHASFANWRAFDSNMRAYREVLDIVASEFDTERRDAVLIRRLFNRDVYFILLNLAGEKHDEALEKLRAIKQLFGSFYSEKARESIELERRVVLDAAFLCDEGVALAVINAGADFSLSENCRINVTDKSVEYEYEVSRAEPEIPRYARNDKEPCHPERSAEGAKSRDLREAMRPEGASTKVITGDITKSSKVTNVRVTDVAADDAGFAIEGTARAGNAYAVLSQHATVTVVAETFDGTHVEWPATCMWHDEVTPEGAREITLEWQAHANYADIFAQGSLLGEWRLFLQVECASWMQKKRLGSNVTPLARMGFASCSTATAAGKLTPTNNANCAFSLKRK